MNGFGLLSITIFTPAITGLVVVLFARSQRQAYVIAAAGAVLTFALSLAVFIAYYASPGGVQLVDRIAISLTPYIQPQYLVGVDGLSAPMVLLTGLLGVVAVIYSYKMEKRYKEYFFWVLTLLTAVMGVFASLDLLQFFIFFEFEVVPMFMLISIWGSGQRHYSAMKFTLFTLGGGAFMLAAMVMVFFSPGINSLAMVSIPELGIVGIPELVASADLLAPAALVFSFFLVGFAVKLPVWPLHSWLPDAHTDAPTAVSILLAGVLLKMGAYGLFRICLGFFTNTAGSFSVHDAAGALAWFAAISAIYGALVTLQQTDLKRMVAFSSVSHMGFVLLGVSAVASDPSATSIGGLNGAALQMVSHGVITGLLFLVVGMLYSRLHTRYIPHMGGLMVKLPKLGIMAVIAGLAALGLPLLAGFSAEILVFLGAFQVWPLQTGIAAFSVVIAAGYILWMVQRVFLGERPTQGVLASSKYDELRDVRWYEMVAGVALLIPIVLIGLWPSLLVDLFNDGIGAIVG